MFRLSYPSEGIIVVTGQSAVAHLYVAEFLRDPIMDLAEVAIQLLQGMVADVRMEWFAEPGMYRWSIQRTEERLSIQITYERDDGMKRRSHNTLFEEECRLVEFTGQVLSVIDSIARAALDRGGRSTVNTVRSTSLGERARRLRSLQSATRGRESNW
jgi:hypothetical protein